MQEIEPVAAAERREDSNYYMSISHLQNCDSGSDGGSESEEEEDCLYDEGHLLSMGTLEGGRAEKLLARTCIPVDNIVHGTGDEGGGGGSGGGGGGRGGLSGLDTFLARSQTLTQTLLERESHRLTNSFALDSDMESSDGEDELAGNDDDDGQAEGASRVNASLESSDGENDDSSEEGGTYPPPHRRPFHSDTLDEEDEEARKSRLPNGAVDVGSLSCASCFATVAHQFRAFGRHWECLDNPTSWRCNTSSIGDSSSSSSSSGGGGADRNSSGGRGGGGGLIVEDVEEEEEEDAVEEGGLTVCRNEHVAAHEVGLKDREARKLLAPKSLAGLSGKKRKFPEEGGGVDTTAVLAALSEERGPLFHPLRCSSCQCCVGGVDVGGTGRAILVAVLPCE